MITNLREIGAASVRRRRHLRQTLLAVGFAGLVALAPTAGLLARINPDFEDAQHAEIGDSAAQLLVQGDLAEFERQADALRQSRELTPAGVWKLGLFYDGSARIAPNHPHDPAWAQAEASTGAYLNAHPTSSSALIAAVRVLNAHAVELREGGADVEDTRAAAALTERAKNLLEKYRASGIRDPDWYASRIVVSLDQESSKSEIIALAKEALLREPTYQPLLYAVSDALRPDHGGSTELHQQFVTLALAASHEQLGSQAYGRIMFNLVRRGTDPIGALGTVGADWPKLKASLAEITSAFPDPWNANAERSMTCLLGSEAEFGEAAARVPRPTFSVAWYDLDAGWGQCNTLQQQAREPAPAPDQEEPDIRELLQVFWSPAFLITILGAVLTSFGILAVVRKRYAAADATDRRFEPTSSKPYRPSFAWRAGQVVIGVFIGVLGVAGVFGFGLLAGSHTSALALPLGLALAFVCALAVCGGAVVIWNSMRFRLILYAERLEVHRLWGLRVFKLPELASRRVVTLQRMKFLELTFKDVARKPYKVQWVFSVDERLQAFLNHLPDADEQAAKALDEEIRGDARLGKTPEERAERYKRTTQYLQKAIYCGPGLLLWSAWYPHPYGLLIAVLVLVPWVCLLGLRMFPGMLQIGTWRPRRALRPDVTALLTVSIIALVTRAIADVPTLDWPVELRWAATAAAIFGAALYWVSTGQPRKWSTVAVLVVLCGAYGYGSTVTADALLDHSRGQVYRTQLLGKHFTSGRNRGYNLEVEPWANGEGAQQLRVSRDLYVQVNVGDSVCIVLHPGALGVRWYHVTACGPGEP